MGGGVDIAVAANGRLQLGQSSVCASRRGKPSRTVVPAEHHPPDPVPPPPAFWQSAAAGRALAAWPKRSAVAGEQALARLAGEQAAAAAAVADAASLERDHCSGGSIEVGIEGGFAKRIRKESPRVGDEARGVGEGERAGAVGVGAVEQEGEAAIVAGGWDGGVEAKDCVRIGAPRREAPALGGEEGFRGGEEVLGARCARVGGECLRDELLAALEVARHQELLGDAHRPLRLPPPGSGRIHGLDGAAGAQGRRGFDCGSLEGE
nr:unnamed protein product [Digitaria exilis]